MHRREFLAGASVLCPGLFSAPVFARDDEPGDDRGRNRGRGGDDGGRDDRGPDDRGGGSSSGHGSAEERSAVFGDSRADRSESRLREDIKENEFREREVSRDGPSRQSGDGIRAGGPRTADDRAMAQQDGLSRLVNDVLDFFRAR